MDYDYVDPIFLHHLPFSLPDYHHHDHQDFQHNNVERTSCTAACAVVGVGVGVGVGVDLSSSWGNDDDEKDVGTLESLVDQARRLVSTCPVSTITYYGGNINMVNDDDMRSMWFVYNPRQIITTRNSVDDITTSTTTMATSSNVVITNDTHGSEIQHRTGKEKEEQIYAVNNEAVEIEHRRASLFTYATTTHTQAI